MCSKHSRRLCGVRLIGVISSFIRPLVDLITAPASGWKDRISAFSEVEKLCLAHTRLTCSENCIPTLDATFGSIENCLSGDNAALKASALTCLEALLRGLRDSKVVIFNLDKLFK